MIPASEYAEMEAKIERLEKALDKACEEIAGWVHVCGCNNTGDMSGIYPFDTKEQWKEWCMKNAD